MNDVTFPERPYTRESIDTHLGVIDPWRRPTMRAHGVAAGVFTVMAVLILLSELGMATGLIAYDGGGRAAAYALGAGLWGFISAILAFLLGGYVAGRFDDPVPGRAGAMRGGLVWAVAVPVMGFLAAILAIGTVTAAGVTTIAAVQADPTAAAEAAAAVRARVSDPPAPAGTVRREFDPRASASGRLESAANAAGAVGFGAVAALLLALGAAAFGGALGASRCKVVAARRYGDAASTSIRGGGTPEGRANAMSMDKSGNAFPRL